MSESNAPARRFPRKRLAFERLTEEQMIANARSFLDTVRLRRSVREFSAEPIPDEVIEPLDEVMFVR